MEYYRASGLISQVAYEALSTPLVEHGIRGNQETLEAITLYSFEQGLTPERVTLENVFAKSTMDY